jgi:hypothetical protein
MSRGELDLEERYRRVLRLLPGYYRDAWEEDMVAAFLDSWLTGDPDEDSVTKEFDRPSRSELASVVGLAARLYLGGAGTPRRYFAWGQAVRGAVLAVMLAHALWGLSEFELLARSRHLIGWLPPPPTTGGIWPTVWYLVGYAWLMAFLALVLGHYRIARVMAVLAVAADLAAVLQAQLAGILVSPFASWAYWILIDVVPVLAMAAFHRDAPPTARRAWLLALPASFLLVSVPVLATEATGHAAWVPDTAGLCCLVLAVVCLAHAPRAWSSRDGTGVWSLSLVLLAVLAGAWRLTSLAVYLQDPHLIYYLQGPHLVDVGLAELLILAVAAALVVPDAVRAPAAMPSLAYPQPGWNPR